MSNLKDNLWVRAADTACYIRNCCLPKGYNSDKTPYEMFFDKKPSVYHLRRFGCLAYNKTMSNRRKPDRKAEKTIFCGYDWESESYILYSVKSGSSVVVMSNLTNNNFITRCQKISVTQLLFQHVVNNQNTDIPTVNSQQVIMILVFYLLLQQLWMNQHIPKVRIRFSYPLALIMKILSTKLHLLK